MKYNRKLDQANMQLLTIFDKDFERRSRYFAKYWGERRRFIIIAFQYSAWNTLMKTIWTLSIVTALAFCLLCGYVIWDSQREAAEQAYETNANLVEAISHDISRNFEMFDLSIQGVIEALAQPGIDQIAPSIRQMALFDNAARASYLNRILILDPSGQVVGDSQTSEMLTDDFSDREYFSVQRDNPDQGLYVSKPFQSRLTPGEWIIALSRRIPGPNGAFGGVVVGTLDLNYFESLFINLRARPLDGFSVIRSDGTMIARYPFHLASIGRDLRDRELFRHFPMVRNGNYEGSARADGKSRIYSFAQVGNFPLIIIVASAKATVFDVWLHKAFLIGLLMAILAVAMVALAFCLARELSRRRLVEMKLEAAAAALAVAAATDGLTGLANRRQFDESAEFEWQRSIRNGEPLSILVVDVDFFKAYNDACGHLCGDDALKAVASCIQGILAQPTDFAARYGGEEFALLLPDTPGKAAFRVAEALRLAIAERGIYHPYGVGQKLSVSIGITTVSPRKEDSFATAFAAADEALFRAKKHGRDRSEHIDRNLMPAFAQLAVATPQLELSSSSYLQ